MRHIIAIHLQNEAGALTRVAGLFSSRGYNIESLSVAPTDDPIVSRLTLVTTGDDAVIGQILHQLGKLVDVVRVADLTRGAHHERELLLLKLSVPVGRQSALEAAMAAVGARVVSPALEAYVIELTSSEAQVNRFIAEASQHGELLEVVRSGSLGIG